MITYVNSKEAKLFEMAAKDLKMTSLNLDEYLNNLGVLSQISPKYVRLPLYEEGHEDEEIFQIDANARTIKIPSAFSKNGIGVVSDEFAEILWFKINRYFDIKDFGKADPNEVLKDGNLHILIQWEAPDGAKGASFAYAIDKDTDPDYIYFGWAITADHLTAKAGNIKFAVRIIEYGEDGKISYSFATQAAAVAVKGNLSFDLTEDGIEIEEVADKIASRLMGGQIAYCPAFAKKEVPDPKDPTKTKEVTMDLPEYIYDLEDGRATLTVEVRAPGNPESEDYAGYDAIAYKWYKKGLEDTEFVLVDPNDTSFQGQYTPALTVTSSGEYYVVIFGMREILDGKEIIYDGSNPSAQPVKFKYHTSVASTKSKVCVIPAPIKLDIENLEDIAKFLVLENEPQLFIKVKRQELADKDTGNRVVGSVELRFEKTASAEKDLDLDALNPEDWVAVDLTSTPGKEAVTEAWIWNEVEYATEEEAIAAKGEEEGEIIHREAEEAVPATEAPITYEVNDAGEIVINMTNAEQGYYRISIVNKLNGSEQISEPLVICRVVKPAVVDRAVAILLTEGGNQSDAAEGSVSRHNRIKANITINDLSDSLAIKWYKVVDEQDPEGSNPADDILIQNATGDEYEPDDDGFFYFMAINTVENTEAFLRSNIVKFAL